MAGTTTSRGAAQLREALRPRMKASELAKRLEVSQQAINAWISGRAKPDRENAARIEDLLGIPTRAWLDEEGDASATGTED